PFGRPADIGAGVAGGEAIDRRVEIGDDQVVYVLDRAAFDLGHVGGGHYVIDDGHLAIEPDQLEIVEGAQEVDLAGQTCPQGRIRNVAAFFGEVVNHAVAVVDAGEVVVPAGVDEPNGCEVGREIADGLPVAVPVRGGQDIIGADLAHPEDLVGIGAEL